MILKRAAIAQAVQPDGGAGGAPGGVDHQIGAQRGVFAGAAVDYPCAGDAMVVGGRGQRHDVVLVKQRHVGDVAHSPADVFLQEGPGREVSGERVGAAGAHHQVPAQVVVQPRQIPAVEVVRAVEDQLVEDAGEQLLDHLGAAGQQAVQVPALRNTPASGGVGVGQRVALHHRNRCRRTRPATARPADRPCSLPTPPRACRSSAIAHRLCRVVS